MKKFIIGILVVFVLFAALGVNAEVEIREARIADDVSLWTYGQRMETAIIHVVRSDNPYGFGRNYVSARDLAEALGYYVDWCGETSRILVSETGSILSSDGQTRDNVDYVELLDVRIAEDVSLWVHGQRVETDIIHAVRSDNPYGFGRNYVSARDLAEALGMTVDWCDETNRILVTWRLLSTWYGQFYPQNQLVPRFGYVLGRVHDDLLGDDTFPIFIYHMQADLDYYDENLAEYFDILSNAGFEYLRTDNVGLEHETDIYWRVSTRSFFSYGDIWLRITLSLDEDLIMINFDV